jgi:hypothetical protein
VQALGVVHVLTGPDHLSALATLSSNVSSFHDCFFLGVRWGIGHSTGLLVVGISLIVFDYHRSQQQQTGDEDSAVLEVPDFLTHCFESLVGIFMLFLGMYGFQRALQKRYEFHGRQAVSTRDEDDEYDDCTSELELCEQPHDKIDLSQTKENSHAVSLVSFAHVVADHEHSHEFDTMKNSNRPVHVTTQRSSDLCRTQQCSAKSLAILVGIVHGLAGPGGVLGVIPAVQLHDWKLASLYLGCFCLSSTITMGCFASVYGSCCSRLSMTTNLEFQIHCFSSSLSILVGITWLVLLSVGKLEDVFP